VREEGAEGAGEAGREVARRVSLRANFGEAGEAGEEGGNC